jgi:hypothetical protein
MDDFLFLIFQSVSWGCMANMNASPLLFSCVLCFGSACRTVENKTVHNAHIRYKIKNKFPASFEALPTT